MKEKAPMKTRVKCEASGSLAVRVLLCSSVSSPSLTSAQPPGPAGMSVEQEELRDQALLGLQFAIPRIRLRPGHAAPPWALMALPWETEAECLRSICHYGNKVARPFFLLLFLLRFHYLMQMRPLMKPFCRVAMLGPAPPKGFIACLSLQTRSGMRRPYGGGFRSSCPALEHTTSCQTSPQVLPLS